MNLPPSPIPETVIDHTAAFLEKYIFIRPRCVYRVLALWVVGTYLHQQFDYFGYLYFHSAREQCGKTRALEILSEITYQPTPVIVSPTEAGLYRGVAGHTQLLDELDAVRNLELLRGVLNAGYHKGGVVVRHEGDTHERVEYQVYAPRAMAGIGLHIFDRTTIDRTFTVEMLPQTAQEKRERFRPRSMKAEIEQLREEIKGWVAENGGQVVAQYNRVEFGYLDPFRDRTIDITEPLAAILETAYRGNPSLRQARGDLLDAITVLRKEQESPSEDYRLFILLIQLAEIEDPLIGSASELAARLPSDGNRTIAEYGLSDVLHRYGFETKSIRKDGEAKKRYSLSLERLRDIAQRFAPRHVVGSEVPSEVVTTEVTTCK